MNKSKRLGMAGLGVGALGIVYGDIGTSPLYAANQIFFGHTGISHNSQSIIGVISLILWTLVIVIAVKYMSLVLRADNAGEGGVFAFFGQLHQHAGKRSTKIMLVLLILAAGFLYGDGLITPAISVLSATEGLQVVNASFASYVLPATLVILTLLFAFQHKGTARVGSVFGPVMLLWFSVIACLGLVQIVKNPSVLEAINPLKAVDFIRHSELHKTFLIFGSIVLVVTGGEAVFADVGHFGKAPIRLGWFYVVMPALLLNYMGQGALLLSGQLVLGGSIFYSMVPSGLLLPMVILATLATIIASQALPKLS
jgi:KUP system potassium uptake protein